MRIDKDLFWYEKRVAELEAMRWKDTERLKTLGEKVLALAQQNLAQLAAIEVKNAAISYLHDEKCDYMRRNKLGDPLKESSAKVARNALALNPSPDLLAQRDKKRDVALLRQLAATFRKKENWGIDPVHYLLRLASERESGEWKPTLEVK